jgi:hypothetical protein
MLGLRVCGSALPRLSPFLLSARTKLVLQFLRWKNNCFAKKSVLANKNLVLLQRVVGEEARSRLTLVPVRKMSEEAAAQAGRSAGQFELFPFSVLSRLCKKQCFESGSTCFLASWIRIRIH